MVVVDASVAVRWYVDLPPCPDARSLLTSGDALVAPDLVVAEVANTAWKLERAGHIEASHAAALVDALPGAFGGLIPCAALAARALVIARELGHAVYDCLYIALAEREEAEFATADAKLYRKLSDARWPIRLRLVKVGPMI